MEFTATDTNALMHIMYPAIKEHGVLESTRNGNVLRFEGNTTVTLTKPRRRVNFSPSRDANPFFHVIESLAMLVGYNSVELLSYFAKNMANYSDDGHTFNAFYGTRARRKELDQMRAVARNLRKDPYSRQEVVLLCDFQDLVKVTKDKACNLCMIFTVNQRTGALDMTTFNRSNDMVWGFVTGANIVHFSYFQEFIACAIGREVGVWHHTSANMHLYLNDQAENIFKSLSGEQEDGYSDMYDWVAHKQESDKIGPMLFETCPDGDTELTAYQFLLHATSLCNELELAIRSKRLASGKNFGITNKWLLHTVIPVFNAFQCRKLGRDGDEVNHWLSKIQSPDWRMACSQWVIRRICS